MDDVNKTCAAVPDLLEKAQEEAYRSKQILQLLSSFSTYNEDSGRVLEGVESLERLAKGMRALYFKVNKGRQALSVTWCLP